MGVENKEKYGELTKDSSNTNIVFTNRTSVPDTKTISGTQSLSKSKVAKKDAATESMI